MTPFKRNLSKLLFIALVLALGTVISGVIYYFKMDSNEDTLNTLLFRELKQVEGTLHRSLDKVRATSEYLLSKGSSDPQTASCDVNQQFVKTAIKKLSVSDDLADIRLSSVNNEPSEQIKKQLTSPGQIVNSFTVTSFDQASFSSHKYCGSSNTGQRLYYSMSLQSSISLSLQQRVNRFQTVALVDGDGTVLSVVNHASLLSDETELLIKKISNLYALSGQSDSENDQSGLVIQGTNFSDTEVSENLFRVYIHPIMQANLVVRDKELYLIGVIEKSAINEQKLKLSPTLLMWLILALLLLIAITPLLKLRYISTTHAIQRGDKSQIILGMTIAIGIVTIGLIQELFFSYFESVKEQQLSLLHREISEDFVAEVNTALDIIKTANDDQCKKYQPTVNSVYDNYICRQSLMADTHESPGTLAEKRLIETVAVVNADGKVSEAKPVLYTSEHLVFEQSINLENRNYVKAGLAGQYWQLTSQQGDRLSSFFMQRVFNIEDGRKNVMISIPYQSGRFDDEPEPFSVEAYSQFRLSKTFSSYQKMGYQKERDDSEDDTPQLIIAGTRFGSLVDRILPNNFGFAVIDEDGNVLFHSDDSLSLIENFFTETNRNPELLIASEHDQVTTPTLMDLDYKGSEHKVLIGPMRSEGESLHNINTIPWRLVVFYNPESLQTNNMILVFLAVFLFMLVVIPGFIVLRYVTHQRFWQELCYFDTTQVKRYKTYALILFAAGMCVQYQTGLVLPFTSRLVLWAAACTLVGLFLARMFKFNASNVSLWKRPLTGLVIITLSILAIDILHESHMQREFISVNRLFSILGLVLLAIAIESFFRWGRETPVTPCLRRDNRPVEKRRYTPGYVWYISGLFYLVAVVPASLVAFTAHDYLLQRQASFEVSHIKHSMLSHQLVFDDYLSFLNAQPCSPTEKSNSLCSLSSDYDLPQLMSSFYPADIQTASVKDCGMSCRFWVLINDGFGSAVTTPDGFFNAIFSITPSQTEFISHLTFEAKQDLYSGARFDSDELHYRADLLMLAASSEGPGLFIALLMFVGIPLVLYLSQRQFIVQRLLGEHLQDQFRVLQNCRRQGEPTHQFPQNLVQVFSERGYSQLILNATRLQAEKYFIPLTQNVYRQRVFRLPECLVQPHSAEQFLSGIEDAASASDAGPLIVVVSAVDQVSEASELRKQALDLLYALHAHPQILLVIVAETAPLYRLLSPSAYENEPLTAAPGSDEKAAWSKLFSEFDKHYAWSPVQKKRMENPFAVAELITFECLAWPELSHLPTVFKAHTQQTRSRWNPGDDFNEQINVEDYWEPEQVVEFMIVHAGALYRRKWEECTLQEKLILWKIANGASINPGNALVIERLVRRSYLFRDKGWHLINESFRQFILTAENDETINHWLDNTSSGAWSVLRIPIFALLLVLLVIFVYSSGSSLNTLLSVATATLGLIPLLLKNLSLLRGGGADID